MIKIIKQVGRDMVPQPPLHPEIEALLAKGHNASYRKGEVIVRPGDDKEIYYIKSGLVKAYVIGNNGEEHIHVLCRPRDFFPFGTLFAGGRMYTYYAAISDCKVVRVPVDKFTEVLRTNAEASYEVMKLMATQYMTYVARVDNLEYKFARERLAYRLLLLARKIGVQTEDGIVLPHLSQYEIGSTINLSRESVSRELSRFERLGLIAHLSGSIVIKSKDGLKRELGNNNHTLFMDE